MKWNSKEPFYFDDDQYRVRAKNMSPDALWMRECLKYRTKVSSGCGVAFSSLMAVPTLGGSVLGLWASGRTLDIARRKEDIIKKEVDRRNLPHYEKKKRDTFIPLSVSLTVISTVGVLTFIDVTGTSTLIANAVSSHGLAAATAAAHQPSQFLIGIGHGITFQADQFFQIGQQHLALGVDSSHTIVGAAGLHSSIPPPHGLAVIKAEGANEIHYALAVAGSQHAVQTAEADKFIIYAATHGHTAELAGVDLGMRLAETGEQQTAQLLIADTGLHGVSTSIQIADLTIKGLTPTVEATHHIKKLAQRQIADEIAEKLYSLALTGVSQKCFIFLSTAGQPISQRIVAQPSSQKCRHDSWGKAKTKCRFCYADIDARTQPYYHCCMCSSSGRVDYDICETCVAGRGCSCPSRANHVLHRKGFLSSRVDYGELEQAEASNFKKGDKDGDSVVLKRNKKL